MAIFTVYFKVKNGDISSRNYFNKNNMLYLQVSTARTARMHAAASTVYVILCPAPAIATQATLAYIVSRRAQNGRTGPRHQRLTAVVCARVPKIKQMDAMQLLDSVFVNQAGMVSCSYTILVVRGTAQSAKKVPFLLIKICFEDTLAI